MLQLVRGTVAEVNAKAIGQASPDKLLEDVRDELIARHKVPGQGTILPASGGPLPAVALRQSSRQRLARWGNRWTQAARRRHRPPKPARKSGHACARRILMEYRQKGKKDVHNGGRRSYRLVTDMRREHNGF